MLKLEAPRQHTYARFVALFTTTLTGCGAGNGFLAQAPQSYALTITATSSAVQHATTVLLNEE